MCGVLVASNAWFDDLTERSFDREEMITTFMIHV